MTKIILITGASGSGKTTIAKYLAEKYQVFHFDDIGVPTIDEMISEHGGPEGWQEWATKSWIEKLSELAGDETIILEGSFNPEFALNRICEEYNDEAVQKKYKNLDCRVEAKASPRKDGQIKAIYTLICLHADKNTREKRLIKYRNQPELATQDMENFAIVLRDKTIALGGILIDSSGDIHDTVRQCLLVINGAESGGIEVPLFTAQSLVKEQFPEWTDLEISPVKYGGWDNATFHLGDEMLLRIPRGEAYALKVPKEQSLLTKLGKQLLISIPKPIAMGKPSRDYHWNWSIYKYLKGDSANSITLSDADLEKIAYDLTTFLNELHLIDTKDAPLPGLHNYWRGEHVSVYECGALKYFEQLKDVIDSKEVLSIWEKAAATKWERSPVWIHGDLAPGNILVSETARSTNDKAVQKTLTKMDCSAPAEASPRNYGLSAVIDFGGCAIGDPACDLAITYTFFKGTSREIFKKQVNLDDDTWQRAKAWVLWKAAFELTHIDDKSSAKAMEQIRIFKEVSITTG